MVTAIAAIAAAGVCALVYLGASALGANPDATIVPGPGGEGPLTLGSIVSAATISVTGAAAVFTLFARFSRQPIRHFRIVALVAFLASLVTPFTIAGVSGATIAMLLVMHTVVAAISVGALTKVAPRW